MDRHVIKGRDENRGKYLCYARLAPELKPTPDGFVWLPDQHKAARWEDPGYGFSKYGVNVAQKHNGYFVKLVAPADVQARVHEIKAFIAEHASGSDEGQRCYWFDGDFHDAGLDYCRECAEKLVDEKYAADPERFEYLYGECEDAEERYRAAIDGGFDIDHDSPPYCETCGTKLSGCLTDYGADQEFEALIEQRVLTPDDVECWAALDHALVNVADDDPRWRKIARVVDAARKSDSNAQASAEKGCVT